MLPQKLLATLAALVVGLAASGAAQANSDGHQDAKAFDEDSGGSWQHSEPPRS